jgi:hypothetical protein
MPNDSRSHSTRIKNQAIFPIHVLVEGYDVAMVFIYKSGDRSHKSLPVGAVDQQDGSRFYIFWHIRKRF